MTKAHPRHGTHQTTLCNSSSLSSHRTENKTPEKISRIRVYSSQTVLIGLGLVTSNFSLYLFHKLKAIFVLAQNVAKLNTLQPPFKVVLQHHLSLLYSKVEFLEFYANPIYSALNTMQKGASIECVNRDDIYYKKIVTGSRESLLGEHVYAYQPLPILEEMCQVFIGQ